MKDAILFFSGKINSKGAMVAFCGNVYSQLQVFLNKQVHLGGYYLHD